MLLALRIKDLAVIESIELEFDQGFTALTGETGAGKSILVDALTLVLGGRASADYIRTGEQGAEVEALFNLERAPAAKEFLAGAGLAEDEDGGSHDELLVRRVVSRSGRNRVWINGRIESTARLFELGRVLVDIYGQHEYQSLLRQERHCRLLDSFAGLDKEPGPYKQAYEEWRKKREEKGVLSIDEDKKREREDLLKYRVNEIEASALKPGEDSELLSEREVLRHAGTLQEASRRGSDYLYESDQAVVGGLKELSDRLHHASQYDHGLEGPAQQVDQAMAILEEAARELRAYGQDIESDPARLQWVEDRLDEIKRLKKKYGESIEEVLDALARGRSELDALDHREERLKELSSEVQAARNEALERARVLTRARKKAGEKLSRRVEVELSRLGMEKTRFEVRVEPLGKDRDELGPEGADKVSFYISPNPGEELKPLTKIASGGELSRIMLALRVLLAGAGEVSTMVFDEVDQGIGGAVAEAVGRLMRDLSKDHQVLCVTHLPQIAAQAQHHFQVTKEQIDQRVSAHARALTRKERVEELSRMVAGKAVTDTARAHAEKMLEMGEAAGGKAPASTRTRKRGRGA